MHLGIRSFVFLGVFKDIGFFRLVVHMSVLVKRIVLRNCSLVGLITVEKLRFLRRLTMR